MTTKIEYHVKSGHEKGRRRGTSVDKDKQDRLRSLRVFVERSLPPGEPLPWDPDDQELEEGNEIVKVQARVGTTPRDRLQWALDFARRDLSTLTNFDWENLRREMVSFDVYVIPPDQVNSELMIQWLKEGASNPETFPFTPVGLPSREKIQKAQDEFRQFVETLLREKCVKIPLPESAAYVLSPPVHGRTLIHLQQKGPPGRAAFAYLLGGFAPLVRECPEPKCKRWFVAGRLNQHYCCPRCHSRATSRAQRERQRERKRKREKLAQRRTRR